LDRLTLTGGEVLDLIGNLDEWTRDHWNRTSEPCWAGQSLLVNPECAGLSIDGDYRTVKGGSWNTPPTPAAIRKGQPLHSPALAPLAGAPPKPARERSQTGFRCVRPGR
jgi:formylglycine-generating enzyme required for sulfatase activity